MPPALPLPLAAAPLEPATAHVLLDAPVSREASLGVEFALQLGSALHRYGAPAHRLEQLMSVISTRLGLEGRFFSTPTAIFASFGPPEALRTGFIRAEPGEMDLGRLGELDHLTSKIIRGECTLEEGRERLGAIMAARPRWGDLATVLSYAISAAAGGRLFGGGVHETAVAGLIGLVAGLVSVLAAHIAGFGRVLEPVAAFLATTIAVMAARLWPPVSVEVSTVAGLIVLLPGLSLTVALTEIATRNLLSGTSRLILATLVFLELAFGVALGGRLAATILPGDPVAVHPSPQQWTMLPAIVCGALALVVLFRARRRDVGWVLLASAVAYLGAKLGTRVLGPELGAFAGALALGSVSNLVARLFDRPAVVTIVPGLMLLVPGSVGFRSLNALLERDIVSGIGTAFTMVLVAVAIVAGLLLANALVPPRKVL